VASLQDLLGSRGHDGDPSKKRKRGATSFRHLRKYRKQLKGLTALHEYTHKPHPCAVLNAHQARVGKKNPSFA
jgi:hypothetical protein